MPKSLNMPRLLELLREQRQEAAARSVERRGSHAWVASSRRLEALNRLIMRSDLEPEARHEAVAPTLSDAGPQLPGRLLPRY